MPTLILHLLNEDAVIGEVDEVPSATQTFIRLSNPRRRDGKEITYLDPTVSTVFYSINRITCMEILPEEGDDDIISFVRE